MNKFPVSKGQIYKQVETGRLVEIAGKSGSWWVILKHGGNKQSRKTCRHVREDTLRKYYQLQENGIGR